MLVLKILKIYWETQTVNGNENQNPWKKQHKEKFVH